MSVPIATVCSMDQGRMARFKDLCIDARSPRVLGGFWAALLGLSPAGAGGPDLKLLGDQPEQTIWINQVPEPKTVKHRVHFDVEVGDLAGLRGLGAAVVREPTDEDHWWVMADPEGGEFCAFLRDGRAALPGRLYEVVVDSADPGAQAAWWGEVFGLATEAAPGETYAALRADDTLPFDYMVFTRVPESKTVKNRIHWDVTTPDVNPLLERGAAMVRRRDDEIAWDVLADPEGNEFCAFTP